MENNSTTNIAPTAPHIIKRYGDGMFTIGEQEIKGSVIIAREKIFSWNVDNTEHITLESLADLLTTPHDIEILLIGTGATMLPVSETLRAHLREKNISTDAMDTGAACRTFNVLIAEERRVAAALIAV